MARFVVGIDLGTSNSAVAYADLREVEADGRPKLRVLELPQLVAPGDVQERPLLPSALYLPARVELSEEATRLPWHATPDEVEAESARPRPVVGFAARRLGAKTPIRLVDSAKSWLCHGGVNRTASILPWHAPEEVPKLSPVDASAAYLAHLAAAWDAELAAGDATMRLAEQDVVITVPASFDDVARRLTLEAAKKAGLPTVTLIEEPLAAFYAYVARTGGTAGTTGLSGGERVLVADVGGGTTDFTLIDVAAAESPTAPLGFERTAVGDHLLLGGDNMDLALAHAVEPDLTGGRKKLDAEGWAQLRLECRLAKEALFTDLGRDAVPVVIRGRGSKLVGGSMKTELTRARLEQVVLEGYFPALPAGVEARPAPRARTGFAEYGLPYAGEPAVTRHLAAFLLRHAAGGEPTARVDAVLYNGGALKPTAIRDRVSRVLGDWLRASGWPDHEDPRALIYDQGDDALELSVARGAAYFGLVRLGKGVRVGGGSPREYFVGLGAEEGAEPPEGSVRVLVVAPRGMQDGQQLEVSSREFKLVTNRPVAFPLYTSTAPLDHPVGEVLVLSGDELHELPPLQTVVKFGKQKAGTTVPVRLQARRTELGDLELSCFSRMSGARFKLEFDLRSVEPGAAAAADTAAGGREEGEPFQGAGTRPPPEAGEVDAARLEAARARLSETFAAEGARPDPDALVKGLETDLGLARDAWPLAALRPLGEHLVELMDQRGASVALEARWLNLTGFCLRPGAGFPLDDWRVRQLWRVHAAGLVNPGRDPTELNWWILWRRVAAGLSRGHQEELASILFPLLIPSLAKRARRRPPRPKSQEAVEMWRVAASLERIGAKSRAQLGDALVEAIESKKAPTSALWCLGRIGARHLLYGHREATVRAKDVSGWIERILALPKPSKDEHPRACLIPMARLTGDRQLDVEEALRVKVMGYLVERGVPEAELQPLREVVQIDAATESSAFGEGLPVGLHLA